MNKIMKIKKALSGRTMIEMLGILAVIGVLSIGSLSAYEYAMDSIDANNILEYIMKLSIDAQNRNQEMEYQKCSVFGLTKPAHSVEDSIEDCYIAYEKHGMVAIYMSYSIDTPNRVLAMVEDRAPRSVRIYTNSSGGSKEQQFLFALSGTAPVPEIK